VGLFPDGGEVDFVAGSVGFGDGGPHVGLVAEALEVEEVLGELLAVAEEAVEPEQAAGAEHAVEVEEDEVEELVVDPGVEEQRGVDEVQRVVEEGQALVDGDVEREQAAQRDHLAEGRAQVERRGHDRHVVLLHARRERARAHAVVQPDADLPGFERQHVRDQKLRVGGVGHHPALPLQRAQVEAGAALEEFLPVLPVREAGEVAAVVIRPPDVLVGRDGPQGLVRRARLRVPLRPARPAPPPRQRLAAPQHQLLRYHPIVPAHLPDVIIHVLLQEPLVAHAGVADRARARVHSHEILETPSILAHLHILHKF
jgi:hypothetical protein